MRFLIVATLTFVSLLAAQPRFSLQQADKLRAASQAALARGDTNAAIAGADALIKLEPTYPQFWMFRATMFERLGDYDRAMKDADEFVRVSDSSADAHQLRGSILFKQGKFKESVEAFEKVIKMHPDRKAHHWQLGISQYYAGQAAAGRDQFESHQTVNANDFENSAWHFLCVAAAESPAKAREKYLPIGPDSRIPMMKLHDFYQGKATADAVLAATEVGEPSRRERRERLFYAHLYLGLYYEATGDKDKALEHIRLAAKDYKPEANYMGEVARIHLAKLTKPAEATK